MVIFVSVSDFQEKSADCVHGITAFGLPSALWRTGFQDVKLETDSRLPYFGTDWRVELL